MTLILTEDQLMFRDAARRFAAERMPVAQLRKLRDTNDAVGFSREAWKEMADMGWAGVLVPEEFGGVGFGHVGAGLIAEEIGRNLSSTPMLSTAVLGATALLKAGTDAHKQSLLPRVSSGDLLLALAADERSRHSPFSVATRATGSDGRYKLSGRKIHVLDGHVADRIIVSARHADNVADNVAGDVDGRDGITLFLVDPQASGVVIARTGNVDSRNAASLELRDVSVSAEDVLGSIGKGGPILESVMDVGRAVLAAELLGVAQESFERTLSYLREREQFGVKIGTFQALQHRAAHLFCELELVRSVVLRALQSLDSAAPNSANLVCLAKAKASEIARIATNEAVQMHGGIGMTDEFDIGFFMKRARAAAETLGDAYYHTDRFAQLAGY